MKNISFLLFAILMSGCAGSYKSLDLATLNYTKGSGTSNTYSTEYRYDILSTRSNKKYAKKEDKSGISLVAIKFTNNSEEAVKGSELSFFNGDQQITPVDKETVYKKLKQGSAIYLLYLPIVLTQTDCSNFGGCETKVLFPIGIPLALINILISSSSNSTFKKELVEYDFENKVIQPGQSEYAIIGVKNSNYGVINAFPTER